MDLSTHLGYVVDKYIIQDLSTKMAKNRCIMWISSVDKK